MSGNRGVGGGGGVGGSGGARAAAPPPPDTPRIDGTVSAIRRYKEAIGDCIHRGGTDVVLAGRGPARHEDGGWR